MGGGAEVNCSRCASTHPIPSCYVCWEEAEEDDRDFDDGATGNDERDDKQPEPEP
jgi:hypothetical protein